MSASWTRRKAAVAAEEAALARAEDAARLAEADAALADRSDEELLAEKGLASPEQLESPEEVRAFLQEALPQRLKLRAMRRLWRLNPVLANLDGLVDYGEDFTDAAMVVENMQTTYQVGKGMLKSIEHYAEQAEAKARAAEAATATAEADAETPTAFTAGSDEDPDNSAPETDTTDPVREPEPALQREAPPNDPLPAASRRMRFAFDGTQT